MNVQDINKAHYKQWMNLGLELGLYTKMIFFQAAHGLSASESPGMLVKGAAIQAPLKT